MIVRNRPRRELSGAFFAFAMSVAGLASGCESDGTRGQIGDGTESAGPSRPRVDSASRSIPAIPEAELRRIAGTIAFVSERAGNADVHLLHPGDWRERRLTSSPGDEFPAAFAGRGDFLLVIETAGDSGRGRGERLVLYDGGGDGHPAPLTAFTTRIRNPSRAPGARWLVFESDAGSFRDIYRLELGGGPLSRLTANREGNFEPDVSPDGRRIVFVSSRDGNAQIYLMNSDGTGERRLTAFHRDDWSPRWSPDGRRIAFLSDREGRALVFVMNADGTGQRRLTGGISPAADVGAEEEFVWSPDGGRIAFVARAGRESRIRVAALDPATGRTIAVSDVTTGDSDRSPTWSPDGRYLAFSSGVHDGADIYVVRADGSGVARLTYAHGPDWLPRWAR